jgi:hypothetical protein
MHSAYVGVSPESIKIADYDDHDIIQASIRNIGDALATDIKFKIYTTFFNENLIKDDDVLLL